MYILTGPPITVPPNSPGTTNCIDSKTAGLAGTVQWTEYVIREDDGLEQYEHNDTDIFQWLGLVRLPWPNTGRKKEKNARKSAFVKKIDEKKKY